MNDHGPMPELKWLPKDSFVVDHHYQRHTDSKRSQMIIEKIACNFLWARFQPPTVTPHKSGKYLVIDGQHRIKAASKVTTISKIQAYVVPELTLKEAAANFIAINKDRVSLHPPAVYRALLTMGDKTAIKIQEVCEEADVTIAKQPATRGETEPRETAAIGAITMGLRSYGEQNVIAALMIIPDTFRQVKGQIRSSALKALMHFFKNRGVKNVDRDVLKLCLKEVPPFNMEENARKKARKAGGSTHSHILEDLQQRYDRKVKK